MNGFNDPRYDDYEISHMIYALGRTSDKLSVNENGARKYLLGDDDHDLFSRHDKDLLDDLYDATAFLLNTDWNSTKLDYGYIREINKRLTRTGALKPGQERYPGVSITISTDYGEWTPASFDSEKMAGVIDSCLSRKKASTMIKAAMLFKEITLAQPFCDGNQRTALLTANALIMQDEDDSLFYPPIGGNYEREFAMLISDLYMKGSDAIMWWIHDHAVNVRIRKHPDIKKKYDDPLKIE